MKILISLLLFTFTLFAHPHIFVDVYPKIGTDAVQIRWVFDEMSSNMLIMDYDFDHDGAISSSENEALRSDIFAHLQEYDYYTYFFKGDQQLRSGKARDFAASVQGSKMIFAFTLPRPEAAETIRFYDPENMTGYQLTEAFVKEANPGNSLALHTHDFDYCYGYILELK